MDIDSIRGGTCSRERSQSISSCRADGECCRRLVKLRGLLFLLTCFLLSGIISMAVDQFSQFPRFSRHDGEAHYKIRYKQSYNHGANRGPHLGQKPRSQHEDTQSNSRKLLLNQLDLNFVRDSSGKEVQGSFFLFEPQHASLTLPLDRKQTSSRLLTRTQNRKKSNKSPRRLTLSEQRTSVSSSSRRSFKGSAERTFLLARLARLSDRWQHITMKMEKIGFPCQKIGLECTVLNISRMCLCTISEFVWRFDCSNRTRLEGGVRVPILPCLRELKTNLIFGSDR